MINSCVLLWRRDDGLFVVNVPYGLYKCISNVDNLWLLQCDIIIFNVFQIEIHENSQISNQK